jgi:hypothetical protein
MPFEPSAVPGALDGLLSMVRGLAATGQPLADLVPLEEIYDGEPVARPTSETYVVIGSSLMDGVPAIEGTQNFIGWPARERDEDFTIHNAVYSRSGAADVKTERLRAYAIVAEIERVLRAKESGADLTLGGAVDWCEVSGRIGYTPLNTQEGAVVRVNFDVVCKARLAGS